MQSAVPCVGSYVGGSVSPFIPPGSLSDMLNYPCAHSGSCIGSNGGSLIGATTLAPTPVLVLDLTEDLSSAWAV
jgi:hypothetical protein